MAEPVDTAGNVSAASAQPISVTVAGVTDATKVAELNVGQFVAILGQVFAQAIVAKTPDAETIAAAFDKVGAIIAAQKPDAGIDGAVRRAQQSILSKAPASQPQTTPKDGGRIVLPNRPPAAPTK